MKLKTKLTPVRFPGGKSLAIKYLSDKFPKDFYEYREPFVGGASIALYLMQFHKESIFWINDIFYPVYCFWKILKENPEKMINYIKSKRNSYIISKESTIKRFNGKKVPSENAINGRNLHIECRNNIDRYISIKEEFITGCLWYILNKLSYSGMSMIGSYAPLAWDQNFTERCINNLSNISNLLNSVKLLKITNLDYREVMNNFNDKRGKDIFYFLDPPYKISYNLYGKNGNIHKTFNHKNFCDFIKSYNNNNKIMITYNQHDDLIKEFPSPPYNKFFWNLTYTIKATKKNKLEKKSGKKGKELLILNYDL